MWKAAVLAVYLLLSGALAKDGHQAYGVKLCGREFIRAVIFTCGGSRWRRAAKRADDLFQDPFPSNNEIATSDSWRSISLSGFPPQQLPEMGSDWLLESRENVPLSRPARSPISEEVLEALRTSDRKGRDVVVGLSNACCKWGCSKSEISSLC